MNSNSNLHAHVHYQPHTANLNNNSSSVSPINSPINTTNHNTNNSSTNSNFATADSLSGNSKPFVVCRVCGDKSSGRSIKFCIFQTFLIDYVFYCR